MDFNATHAKFKDADSPTVEGQIRWLQKQGFAQHQIDQAMIMAYTEIDKGDFTPKNGFELDQFILEKAKRFRTEELTAYVKNLESFEQKMREKWELEQKTKSPSLMDRVKGWFK